MTKQAQLNEMMKAAMIRNEARRLNQANRKAIIERRQRNARMSQILSPLIPAN